VLLAHGADAAQANLNGSTPMSRVHDAHAEYDPFEDWYGPYLGIRLKEAEALLTAALATQNHEGK
jgi:hypothetical protein